MKLSELATEEIGMVADELYVIQMHIKRDINTNYREMSESKIRVLKAIRTILKKEAFSVREKAIKKRNERDGENNEN